ncbi:MAG: HD domain-containing protein, partial [Nitrososphaeraceae archaeon]|nr:HD domain-containing protein [Nitrososphaeraceae archaeon]
TLTRLHFIRQNALACFVFPGAVTTRFSHVIGALHTGGKLIYQLLNGISERDFNILFPDIDANLVVKAIRLACLFHDIGHGPFSHSAEDAMLKITKEQHHDELEEAKRLFDETDENKIPIHEFFSYKLVNNGEIKHEILTQEGTKKGKSLIDFVTSLLIKSKNTNNTDLQGYLLLRKLISSQLDADRMDYLLRDSFMSGVKFGLVDIDRIIKNKKIVRIQDGVYNIAIHERALGTIEDMLDARYKMYRWFYSHHTVVVLNELLKMAIDMLIGDPNIGKLFHWSEYENGYSTDDYIISKLIEQTSNENFRKVKGLIDRRYLPVSIFKSTPDFARIVTKIDQKSTIHRDDITVRELIIDFFKSEDGENIIKTKLEENPSLRNCEIFQTQLKIKPYEPLSQKDQIYLYRNENEDLCELLTESRYFKKINEEWIKYHGLYLFYLFPGEKRKEFLHLREDIIEIIASAIVGHFSQT